MSSFAALAASPTRMHTPGEDDIAYDSFSDPLHPSNWPAWKRHCALVTLSWMAFVSNYSAASHLVVFEPMSEYYGVSIAAIANTIGIAILGLGVGAFLWNPLSGSIGRRPTYLVSWTFFFAIQFWLAFSPDFNSFAAGRFFSGFAGAVVQCVPVASICEMYRPQWRGTAIGFWSLFLTMGPPSAPILGAAVTLSHPWQFVYYIDIIFAGTALVMILLFCPETLYTPPTQEQLRESRRLHQRDEGVASIANDSKSDDNDKEAGTHIVTEDSSAVPLHNLVSGRIGMLYNPLKEPKRFLIATLLPIRMMGYLNQSLPALFGAIVFGWAVGFTILIPQMVARPPYLFSSMLVACCYIPALVGSIIGKLYGGYGSDWVMAFFARRNGGVREPEYRLWNCIPAVICMFIGLMIYGFGFGQYMSWWVPIIFGVGITYMAVVALTGAIQAYLNDVAPQVGIASVQVYNFYKTTFSFGVPFFIAELDQLPNWAMGSGSGMIVGNLVQAVIALGVGLTLFTGLIIFGKRLRKAQGLI